MSDENKVVVDEEAVPTEAPPPAMMDQPSTEETDADPRNPNVSNDEGSDDAVEEEAQDSNEPDAPAKDMLDETTDYGIVRGVNEWGAKFFQNGEYFDSHKMRIPEMSMLGVEKKVMDGPAVAKEEEPVPVEKPDTTSLAQQGKVNLQKWADNEERYLWVHVQSAVESAVGTRPQNKAHALELLNTHGVLVSSDPVEGE